MSAILSKIIGFLVFFEPIPIQSECVNYIQGSGRFFKLGSYSEDTDWIFVRNTKQPIYDTNYIPNLLASFDAVFRPWFDEGAAIGFEDILLNQHRILVSGPDGVTPYVPLNAPFKYFGGSFRHSNAGFTSVSFHRLAVIGNVIPSFKPLLQRRLRGIQNLRRHARSTSHLRLKRIPLEKSPKHTYFSENEQDFLLRRKKTLLDYNGTEKSWLFQNGTHYFVKVAWPPYADIPVYLNVLSSLMQEIRKKSLEGKDDGLIRLLAEYLQLFVAALPFEAANFSLAMAQVNYVLVYHGYNAVPPGNLDLIALILSDKEFVEYFRAYVGA